MWRSSLLAIVALLVSCTNSVFGLSEGAFKLNAKCRDLFRYENILSSNKFHGPNIFSPNIIIVLIF